MAWYTEDMKKTTVKQMKKKSPKTKRVVRETKAMKALRAERHAIAERVRRMLMHRKEVPLRVFFISLGVAVLVLMLVTVKSFEYEMSMRDFVPVMFHAKPSPLENEITDMTKGYPIEEMAPYIADQDPDVAAFLVSIAKKESNWGKRVPVLDGRDCYNYWGYRGKCETMGTGGHTCFKNRKEAVAKVSKRIETLVKEQKLDTPSEMVVWKCGSSCSGHSPQSVNKWISDVSFYFKKLHKTDN